MVSPSSWHYRLDRRVVEPGPRGQRAYRIVRPGSSIVFEGTVSGTYLTRRAVFASTDDGGAGFSVTAHRSVAPRRWRVADEADVTIASFRSGWFGRGRTRLELADGTAMRLEPVDRLTPDIAKAMVLADTSRFVLRDADRRVAATVPPPGQRRGIRALLAQLRELRTPDEQFRPCAALVVDVSDPPDERITAAVLLVLREVVERLRTP